MINFVDKMLNMLIKSKLIRIPLRQCWDLMCRKFVIFIVENLCYTRASQNRKIFCHIVLLVYCDTVLSSYFNQINFFEIMFTIFELSDKNQTAHTFT